MGKWPGGIKELSSFGEMTLANWLKLKRPYIAVFECEKNGMTEAKLYDGAEYTGFFVRGENAESIYRDIERYTLGLAKEKPGPADPKNLICVYM